MSMAPDLQVSSINTQKQIPIDTIISLAEQGKNNTQIAKIVGCSDSNIIHRFNAWGYAPNRDKYIDKTKKTVLGLLQARIINAVRQDEIEKAPIQTKIWSIGVLQDKIDNLERKAQQQQIEDTGMDDLSGQLARIAARSPVVIQNIINIVGQLPEHLRDRVSNLIPQSQGSGDIIDMGAK